MNPSVSLPAGPVRAVALVLHGGRSTGRAAVRPWQLAVLRMVPFARSLSRSGRTDGLAVARLRFGIRGWNGEECSPVADARAALDRLAERFPGVPVALVGHSMGGRTALYVADHPAVRAVVALAPWIEPEDAAITLPRLAARRLLIVHGRADRMTDPRASAQYAQAAADTAESASYIGVDHDAHAMLRRAALWHELATGYVLAVVCARSPAGTGSGNTTNDKTTEASTVLAEALAGTSALVV